MKRAVQATRERAARRRLVIEADGGSRGNPGVAGYGAVVRDRRSEELLAERAAPLGTASNNVAEYSGLIAGLLAAEAIEPGGEIDVRMDSKLVIEQMAGRWKIKHTDMQRLALEAKDVVRRITGNGGSVTWTWIPREANKAADKLSNDGMDGRTIERDLWRGDDPDAVVQDASLEAAPLDPTEAIGHSAVGETRSVAQQADSALPAADLGRPTRILLVRHGVTDFTVQGRLDGRGGADPALNAEGRAQAAAAARALVARVADAAEVHVVSSSMARARQTGALIAEAVGAQAGADADWDEQGFGDWDGLTFGEIAERHPQDLRRLRVDESFAVAGGGETHRDTAVRVERAMQRVVTVAGPGGTAVLVTHRMPIMIVLASILGLSRERAWQLAVSPGSITGVEVWRDGSVSIEFVNDTHHLD